MNDLQDAQRMQRAGADLLSLALMDARNRTLAWLALFEGVEAAEPPAAIPPALWLAGHAGWFQERWIARNLVRGQGAAADPARTALASIEPAADAWWDPALSDVAARWRAAGSAALPGSEATRAYLVETLETTLDLLAQADGSEASLHCYRRALFHEDALVERFAALAQALGLRGAAALVPPQSPLRPREPLGFGAQPATAHDEPVPPFEIDAQPVSWQQFAEFAEDGGYDEPRWWSDAGWAWVQARQRRAPRDVEQLRHGVLLRSFGQLVRAPAALPVCGVSRHEAMAWCAWAGRRLPTGPEWALAAQPGGGRGFAWGQVSEWVLGRDGALALQRGVPWMAPRRLLQPAARHRRDEGRDDGFFGFRSAAP